MSAIIVPCFYGVLAHRAPTPLLWPVGPPQRRTEESRSDATLLQLPPRNTRYEAVPWDTMAQSLPKIGITIPIQSPFRHATRQVRLPPLPIPHRRLRSHVQNVRRRALPRGGTVPRAVIHRMCHVRRGCPPGILPLLVPSRCRIVPLRFRRQPPTAHRPTRRTQTPRTSSCSSSMRGCAPAPAAGLFMG